MPHFEISENWSYEEDKMTTEERLQVKLEEEKMAHEMDVQMLINAIECLESKLDFIARYCKYC